MESKFKSEPEIEEVGQFLNEFNKESDRGAVLISASLLDERLMKILEAFFIEIEESRDLLSAPNAPLGTFAARLSAAYSLGLIQENEYQEITIIRKIRNEFGHKWSGVNFESQRITSLFNNLPWLGPLELEKTSNSRNRFDFAVVGLLMDLLWRVRLVHREKRKLNKWLGKNRP